jgi:hypothetical protein
MGKNTRSPKPDYSDYSIEYFPESSVLSDYGKKQLLKQIVKAISDMNSPHTFQIKLCPVNEGAIHVFTVGIPNSYVDCICNLKGPTLFQVTRNSAKE